MPISYPQILDLQFPEQTAAYGEPDTILYALAVGMGRNAAELDFVYQKRLMPMPTQVTVMAWNDAWTAQAGIDYARILHGEQAITLHSQLLPADRVTASTRIVDVVDKGAEKGAVLKVETRLRRAEDGRSLATLVSTLFARGDGGFGGKRAFDGEGLPAFPDRAPDMTSDFVTREEQAGLYRLCGDMNPLHIDPDAAVQAGFDRPILHGLCTFGIVAGEVVRHCCGLESARLSSFKARFNAPVYPGEVITTRIWKSGRQVYFTAHVMEREVCVLSNGQAELSR